MYPLKEDFIADIQAFIKSLKQHEGIRVKTNSMSTRVYGAYADVFSILQSEIEKSAQQNKHVSFVMKLIPMDLDTD